MQCDFCHDHSEPVTHIYKCQPFKLEHTLDNGSTIRAVVSNDWGACDKCAAIIDNPDMSIVDKAIATSNRSMQTHPEFIKRTIDGSLPHIHAAVAKFHGAFLAHKLG